MFKVNIQCGSSHTCFTNCSFILFTIGLFIKDILCYKVFSFSIKLTSAPKMWFFNRLGAWWAKVVRVHPRDRGTKCLLP